MRIYHNHPSITHLLSPITLGGGYDNALIYFLRNVHSFIRLDSRMNQVSYLLISRWYSSAQRSSLSFLAWSSVDSLQWVHRMLLAYGSWTAVCGSRWDSLARTLRRAAFQCQSCWRRSWQQRSQWSRGWDIQGQLLLGWVRINIYFRVAGFDGNAVKEVYSMFMLFSEFLLIQIQ